MNKNADSSKQSCGKTVHLATLLRLFTSSFRRQEKITCKLQFPKAHQTEYIICHRSHFSTLVCINFFKCLCMKSRSAICIAILCLNYKVISHITPEVFSHAKLGLITTVQPSAHGHQCFSVY